MGDEPEPSIPTMEGEDAEPAPAPADTPPASPAAGGDVDWEERASDLQVRSYGLPPDAAISASVHAEVAILHVRCDECI